MYLSYMYHFLYMYLGWGQVRFRVWFSVRVRYIHILLVEE